jgi:predicted secreted protein
LDLIEFADAVDEIGDDLAEDRNDLAFAVGVSSMTSCRIAATSVSPSKRKSARMSATATGWVM